MVNQQREGQGLVQYLSIMGEKKRLVRWFVGNITRRKCFKFNALRSIFCSVRANSALIVKHFLSCRRQLISFFNV
jgi:hypothetical protein